MQFAQSGGAAIAIAQEPQAPAAGANAGWLEHLIQAIPDDVANRAAMWGGKLAVSLVILLAALVAGTIVKKLIQGFAPRADPQKEEVLTLLGSISKTALVVFGAVTALGTLGINVSALVAGLGLTGFALGFAFRDALSNVLAGVMILMYRPFRRGDHITVVGLEGTVSGIDLRYTTLRHESRTFLIPNSILLTNAISLTHPEPERKET